MRILNAVKKLNDNERGVTLIETLIALAILGMIAAVFLNGLTTTSKAVIIADERTTTESLARSQMEWAKNAVYVNEAAEYSPAPVPDDQDYLNYSVAIAAEPLHIPDNGIQKIIVTVEHADKEVITLEGYKVDR